MSKIVFLILFFAVWQTAAAQTPANVKYGQPLKVAKPYINPQLRIIVAEVDVTIEIDETGKPAALAAVNGSPMLRSAILGAAVKTAFAPTTAGGKAVKAKGVISYKVLENRDVAATFYLCAETENCDLTRIRKIKERTAGRFAVMISDAVINNRASRLEKPKPPREAAKQLCGEEVVTVRAMVQPATGVVSNAYAVSGAEILHSPAEAAALNSKFAPILDGEILYSGLLVYNFSFKTPRGAKPELGKPVQLPKPVSSNANTAAGKNSARVEVIVDERGNVISATAISGNPALYPAVTAAARGAKFTPTKIGCKAVAVKAVISYDFLRSRETKVTVTALTPIVAPKK